MGAFWIAVGIGLLQGVGETVAEIDRDRDENITCLAVPGKCGCYYRVNDRTVGYMNLSRLSTPDTKHPPFNATLKDGSYYFLFNPCNPIDVSATCAAAKRTAVCEHGEGPQGDTYACGRIDQLSFYINGSVVQAVFRNSPGDVNYLDGFYRQTRVTLKCKEKQHCAKITFQDEGPAGFYWMELEWRHFCPRHLSPVPSDWGEIVQADDRDEEDFHCFGVMFTILTFVAVFVVYFISGRIIKWYCKRFPRVKRSPSHDFWVVLPGPIRLDLHDSKLGGTSCLIVTADAEPVPK